jgi:hypothetical protein
MQALQGDVITHVLLKGPSTTDQLLLVPCELHFHLGVFPLNDVPGDANPNPCLFRIALRALMTNQAQSPDAWIVTTHESLVLSQQLS